MANMQPTRSIKYLTNGTAEGSFEALRSQFAASTHWEVQYQTAGTGFVVRALGGADTVSQYWFARSSNNVTMRIEPTGSITDGSGTGISAMASPATAVRNFASSTWQFHEWVDAFVILLCDYSSPILDYPWGIHAGLIVVPSLAPGGGLTGLGYLDKIPANGNAGGNAWLATGNAMIRVGESGVESTDWRYSYYNTSSFYNSTTNGNQIGTRDQPESIVCVLGPNNSDHRKVGFYKYCFSRVPAQTPGVCQLVGGVRKMQHLGGFHSSSTDLVMGIEDDFQPAGAPT